MSESSKEARSGDFVPTSFEDLRRTTREESAAFEAQRQNDRAGPRDLVDMTSNGDFMRKSGMIGACAFIVGLLLIVAANFKPLFETAAAVQTAAVVSADKAGQQVDVVKGAVGGVADKAAFVKETDMKAIDMACLSGKGGCPQGARSPFK